MTGFAVKRIVIVGGGTSGWMAASLVSRSLGTHNHTITLIESDEIGTVGVGEATIPPIIFFNEVLGINEDEFIRETNATFKLGIDFVDWKRPGSRYFHPFGSFGTDMDGVRFTDFWLRFVAMGGSPDFSRFNAESLAAMENRYGRTVTYSHGSSIPPVLYYAFQFDAGLYAAYLRRYSEKRGVVRKEGKVVRVEQHPETGFVTRLVCGDGSAVEGDLFLDCSGFRGLLIEQTLKAGYEDWSRWLPCDRAVAVPCEHACLPSGQPAPLTPYTRATAREAGWQWRIPLQHRIGNGYVFCSQFVSEDEASEKLLSRLDGKPLKDPKVLRFTTGHRKQMWVKNVIALGLASGFLEPLESTSIHLAQMGMSRLISMMPKVGFNPAVMTEYNRAMNADYNNTKDFLIAHYKITQRDDTAFWRHCRDMEIPDSLAERLEIFREQGRAGVLHTELFKESSWFAVLVGQGMWPQSYNPVADAITADDLKQRMAKVRTQIQDRLRPLPSHDDFIAKHCRAPQMDVM